MASSGHFHEAGRQLRQRRKSLGLTQEEVAAKVPFSARTLGDMERGKPQAYQDAGAVMEAVGWTAESWGQMLMALPPTPLEKESVGGAMQARPVYRRRDESALVDAVRELRRALEQQARGTEAAQRAAAAIAAELEADDE